jgi:hypothetical protein
MALTEKDRKEIAAAVAAELSADMELRHDACKFGIDPGQHQRDHEQMQEMAVFFARVNNIKWSIPRTVVSIIVALAVVTLLKSFGFSIDFPPVGGP